MAENPSTTPTPAEMAIRRRAFVGGVLTGLLLAFVGSGALWSLSH